MKLGSFFIICKPTFQVPNKTLESLFNLFYKQSIFQFFFQTKVQFISYTIAVEYYSKFAHEKTIANISETFPREFG